MSNAFPFANLPLVATASVRTHRFVKQTGEATGTECTAITDRPVGISVPFTDRFPSDVNYPGTPADTVANGAPLCAVNGRPLPYFGPGILCEVIAGGDITAGAELTNDTAGAAIVATATSAGVWVAATAQRAASTGELVQVLTRVPYQLQVVTTS